MRGKMEDRAPELAVAFAVEQDGAAAQAAAQGRQHVAHCLAVGEVLASAEQREVAVAAHARRRLDDREERAFMGVAKYREQRRAIALTDGIVAPLAARDLAAVEREELVQFEAAEENNFRPAPVIVQAENCRHRPGLKVVGHAARQPVFPISRDRSSTNPPSRESFPWFASAGARGYGSAAFWAPAERFVSDIFQEIDEELRRENFAKLWQRYGVYLIGVAVLIVVAVAAVVGWRTYEQRLHEAEGERYALALDLARQGKDKEATDVFAEVGRQARGGHAMLARFEEAALKFRGGDTKGAMALYDALSADSSLDPAYRDLARLMAAQDELKDGDPRAVITRVAPLTSTTNPWHPTALELTALAQLKAGNLAEARATYQRIADDLQAPQGLRARAAEILAWPAESKTEAAPPAAVSPPSAATLPAAAAPSDAATPPPAAPPAETQGQR
jgi:hypothetical protein